MSTENQITRGYLANSLQTDADCKADYLKAQGEHFHTAAGLPLADSDIFRAGYAAGMVRQERYCLKAPPGAIGITAVAVTKKNDDGELYLDWLLEGGICELEHPGVVLLATDGASLTGDDGHGEVYTKPQSGAKHSEHSLDMVEHPSAAQLREFEPDSVCEEADGCPTEMAVLKRFWREYREKPVADEILEAIKWADHLCFECGALTHTRTPSVHVYNKTFAAVEAAKAVLAAAPQPAANGYMAGAPLLSTAAQDVLAERNRQITAEGWTPAHDDEHGFGEMAAAAGFYALHAHDPERSKKFTAPQRWPWDFKWWKPGPARRMLVKAGALILAEIERLDRAAAKQAEQEQQP